MRKLTYLVDGLFTTASYQEAKEWCERENGHMEIILSKVNPDPDSLSPVRKAMLEQFGMVSPRYRDRVALS